MYLPADKGKVMVTMVGEVAIIYIDDFQMKAKHNRTEQIALVRGRWRTEMSKREGKRILDHLNAIEPNIIKFTKEEEENNQLAVLDIELKVNRKKQKIEFNVHYKDTNTIITIKKRSNYRKIIKRGVIKGTVTEQR